MAYIKVVEVAVAEGKTVYTSELLTNKFNELVASGDLTNTHEILENGNKRTTQSWIDEAAYNSFISWLNSSGEYERMQQYHRDNNLNPVVS